MNVGCLGCLKKHITCRHPLSQPEMLKGKAFLHCQHQSQQSQVFLPRLGGTSVWAADSVCPASCHLHAGVCARSSGTRSAGCPPSLALKEIKAREIISGSSAAEVHSRNMSEVWGHSKRHLGELIKNAGCSPHPKPAESGSPCEQDPSVILTHVTVRDMLL